MGTETELIIVRIGKIIKGKEYLLIPIKYLLNLLILNLKHSFNYHSMSMLKKLNKLMKIIK